MARTTPSTVSPFSKLLASVPATVVATRTEFFHVCPWAKLSTYALVAASLAALGLDRPVMLPPVIDTDPADWYAIDPRVPPVPMFSVLPSVPASVSVLETV